MKILFQNLKNIFKKELSILWIFSVLLGFALIALQIKNKLPLGAGDFVFLSILSLCVALYRPRWMFLLFVALVPLENVILASGFLPIQLRPYQFAGAVLAIALIILWSAKRLKYSLLKPTWIDWVIISLVPLSFLSLIVSPYKNIGLKNNLVLLSFVVLYYLVRNFLRKKKDLVDSALFFLGSNIVVLAFGFWQVFADKFSARSLEVMFGRPNSTFTEADWLGIFLCFALAISLTLSRFFSRNQKIARIGIFVLIFLNLSLLILTLSRSAWIGAVIILFFYLALNLFEKNREGARLTLKIFAKHFGIILLIFIASLAAIHFGKLSKFDIFDRARSAATSEQKITIACNNRASIPQSITTIEELTKYNCQHINLEEIDYLRSKGMVVVEIFRKDPNVATRSQIYKKSIEIIRAHPILGVGFGSITEIIGADERGAGLNESNIFLQVWAGSGIFGLMALVAILGYLFIFSFRRISPICPLNKIIGCPIARDDFEKTQSIFILLGLAALLIPNLFNAGLLMGLFWLGLAIFVSATESANLT